MIDATDSEFPLVPDELIAEENESYESDDFSEQPPEDIVTFNELRSCADLVRMWDTKQLTIDPDFQRDVVWPNASQTRFVDSLTKQLPIPSMCISLDAKTSKRLVIDGLQRMHSIIRFLTDDNWRLSTLKDVDHRLSGKKVETVRDEYPQLYDRVENLTIPITVLRCDYSKASHMEYLFTIFHRLNTGGNKLTNQEIRNCIYSGEFNEMLHACVDVQKYRQIFDLKDGESYRFMYQEFALRVFAFDARFEKYDGNLSRFLNRYMDENRHDQLAAKKCLDRFLRTVEVIYENIASKQALSKKMSRATVEGLFVGIIRNLEYAEQCSSLKLKAAFTGLRSSEEFSPENLKNALTSKSKQISRLQAAVTLFGP